MSARTGASPVALGARLLLEPVSFRHLALITAPLVLGALWLLLAPQRLLSQEMTWDLLFNLAGAWRIHTGQVPHVDYHEPVGALYFLLTAIGFTIVGVTPHAALVGAGLMLGCLFPAAVAVASRRLPLLPAALFVTYCSLLVLLPANVGDQPNAYSFAMAYNRYGWSALAILLLLLFLPPRQSPRGLPYEVLIGALILLGLFHLKITYAVAGGAGVVVALVAFPHVRAQARWWLAALIVLTAYALTDLNRAYLSDLLGAALSGQVRASLSDHVRGAFAMKEEYALLGGTLLVLLWLYQQRRIAGRTVVAGGFLIAMAGGLLTQNAQAGGLPLGIVVLCLLYDGLSRRRFGAPLAYRRSRLPLMAAVLLLPTLSILAAAATLVGYHRKAAHATNLYTVAETNLRGLAVPRDRADDLLRRFADGTASPASFSQARAERPRFELTQFEYVQTILEAADLVSVAAPAGSRVLLLDQINPLPFMLGMKAPRGANLWNGSGAPMQPARVVLDDADLVLVPKFPIYAAVAAASLKHYSGELAIFTHCRESRSWILLSRLALADPNAAATWPTALEHAVRPCDRASASIIAGPK